MSLFKTVLLLSSQMGENSCYCHNNRLYYSYHPVIGTWESWCVTNKTLITKKCILLLDEQCFSKWPVTDWLLTDLVLTQKCETWDFHSENPSSLWATPSSPPHCRSYYKSPVCFLKRCSVASVTLSYDIIHATGSRGMWVAVQRYGCCWVW